MLARVSINSLWLFIDKSVKSLMLLMVGAMVIRYLGPDDYGKLAFVIAIVSFFQPLVNLGFDGIFVREIVKLNKAETDFAVSTRTQSRKITDNAADYVFSIAKRLANAS
jgi:O-antigen/teichoic acid export membrane protein